VSADPHLQDLRPVWSLVASSQNHTMKTASQLIPGDQTEGS
jgi:hypothetical protein